MNKKIYKIILSAVFAFVLAFCFASCSGESGITSEKSLSEKSVESNSASTENSSDLTDESVGASESSKYGFSQSVSAEESSLNADGKSESASESSGEGEQTPTVIAFKGTVVKYADTVFKETYALFKMDFEKLSMEYTWRYNEGEWRTDTSEFSADTDDDAPKGVSHWYQIKLRSENAYVAISDDYKTLTLYDYYLNEQGKFIQNDLITEKPVGENISVYSGALIKYPENTFKETYVRFIVDFNKMEVEYFFKYADGEWQSLTSKMTVDGESNPPKGVNYWYRINMRYEIAYLAFTDDKTIMTAYDNFNNELAKFVVWDFETV